MVFLLCMSTYFAVFPAKSVADDNTADADDSFGIILDGGSSGTKLKVYKWNSRTSDSINDRQYINKDVIRDLHLVKSTKFKPSIDKFALRLDELDGYFDTIMQSAVQEIPQKKHGQTPLYFLATAGLRILPINVTENLLSAIEKFLQESSKNPFHTPENSVRVLSGEEEGVYAWVAANYLRGFFWSDMSRNEAVGVLEMGGGSTQIAFLPDHSIYANMFPTQIGDVTYHLYAHSYLFYGQNYIISRINDYLVALSGSKRSTENPCMLTGDNKTVLSLGESVHIQGSSNSEECLKIISIFLETADDSWCYPKPCAIGRTYQPPVQDLVFYAISAFAYAPTYLEALDEVGRLNLTLLKSKAAQHCSKTLDEVVNTGLEAQYASPYCVMGLYIPSLLLDAYGFSQEKNAVFVKSSINGVNIDWALGAMLLFAQEEDDICITSGSAGLVQVKGSIISSILFFTLVKLFCDC